MRLATFIFLCLSLLAAVSLHFNSDYIPDPDIFYHFRHAEIYGSAGGIFGADFPWVRYSVISKFSSDIWYGFHLLVIPFTWAGDPIFGLRLAGIFITWVFLVSFYIACSHLDIKPAPFWPFFILFSSPFLLYRLAMQRPHVLSLGLDISLFAFLAAGNIWGVFFAGWASTFLHLGLFWVSFLILGAFAVIKLLGEKEFPWRECLALTGGVLVGWVLRPNPLGAVKIAYIQVFQLTLEKFSGAPLNFGSELTPLRFTGRSNFWLFTLVWLCMLLFFFWRVFTKHAPLSNYTRTLLLASGSLSIMFFLMSVFFARRAFDFCSSFGVIFIGLVFSNFLYRKQLARIALIVVFIIMAAYSFHQRNQALNAIGWDSHRFESVAKWLESNSKPGEIVFNLRWEYFPELFFWNTKNVYISGMDPIFQYAYDPELYWEAYHLGAGKRTQFTCAATSCDEKNLKDTYRVLKEDFKARYVFLAKPVDAPLYYYLLSDNRFSLKNANQISAVFEIK